MFSAKMSKSLYIVSSSIALGIGAYAAYRYWKTRESIKDEGFEDTQKVEENPEKILVLGLQSAGKTALVSQITTGLLNVSETQPTEGFHVTNFNYGSKSITIWDVDGRENIKRFWSNFIQDTDLLVFVVDAADTHAIVLAVKEIKALAGDERLKNVPILVVASKQDLPTALTPEQVADALDIKSISPYKHNVKVLGAQLDPQNVHSSVLVIKNAIFDMI